MNLHDSMNSKVELTITNGSSTSQHGSPRSVSISVRDHASGQMIVEIPLTADILLGALAGSVHSRLPAWVVPEEYRSRLGKKSVHNSIKLPSEYKIPYSARGTIDSYTELPDDVAKWAMENSVGHDSWWMSNTNQGWKMHLQDYVDPSEPSFINLYAHGLRRGDEIVEWLGEGIQSRLVGTVTYIKSQRGKKLEVTVDDGMSDIMSEQAPVRIKRTGDDF